MSALGIEFSLAFGKGIEFISAVQWALNLSISSVEQSVFFYKKVLLTMHEVRKWYG
jgi:hypothetical protein